MAPVYQLEYQLYKNLPNFTGVYVIFQISILADLFHLWGMKKNTSVVAKAQLDEGGSESRGTNKIKFTSL